jgi:hypothetical protein
MTHKGQNMDVYTLAQRQLPAGARPLNPGTREEWLTEAVHLLDDLLPDTIERTPFRVSVGFPVGTRGGNGGKAIGQCHYAAADGIPQLFIHPELTDPVRILDVLLHERIHAVLPVGTGHKRLFAQVAYAAGLAGKPTATVASDDLVPVLQAVADTLGEYPHGSLDYNSARGKKQGTRMLKCECTECGFIFRTTAKWLEQVDAVQCPDPACSGQVLVG